jgi:dihydropyrimidinase
LLTKADLDKPGLEGAKWIFSPPAREASDQEALWQALALGDLQVISSDHAPYRMDESGKLAAGPDPDFKRIPNGMPGLQWRLPVLFEEIVSNGRFDACRLVEWTSTQPAKLHGLYPNKGTIAIGADADIVVWDPQKLVTLSDAMVKDRAGYSPFAGRRLKGWPVTVVRRGEVIVENENLKAAPGSGRFLAREGGWAAQPLGRLAPEFDPRRNFGAEL